MGHFLWVDTGVRDELEEGVAQGRKWAVEMRPVPTAGARDLLCPCSSDWHLRGLVLWCQCVYMCVCVCTFNTGALGSIIFIALTCISPHQPPYASNEAVIQKLTQTYLSPRRRQKRCCFVCEIRRASEFISTIYSHSHRFITAGCLASISEIWSAICPLLLRHHED